MKRKAVIINNERACTKCGEVKELNDKNFDRTKFNSWGFTSQCKECRKKREREPKTSDETLRKEFIMRYGIEPNAEQFQKYKKWRKVNRWAGIDYRG